MSLRFYLIIILIGSFGECSGNPHKHRRRNHIKPSGTSVLPHVSSKLLGSPNDDDLLSVFPGLPLLSGASPPLAHVEDFAKILLGSRKYSSYTVDNLVIPYGYPLEKHHVTTTDGYILELHRIPYGKNGRNRTQDYNVAFLLHGLLTSSCDWLMQGPNKSLAFLLADAGYDVWMGNARGNTFSRKHVTLTPEDAKFWQFSWHEIGIYDFPQMVDYILLKTGQPQVFSVGHSQGTTAFYVMASTLTEYNNKILCHASLAPVVFMNHLVSPLIRTLATFRKPLEILLALIGQSEFLPKSEFLQFIFANVICHEDSITQLLCTNALFAIFGFSRRQLNTTLLPTILHYIPAGASTRQLLHYGQEVNSGQFRQYDYGPLGNWQKYGQAEPPNYNLSQITVPVHLYYSQNDWLAAVVDVDRLFDELKSSVIQTYLIPEKNFNHIDFTYGIGARSLVYDVVLRTFERYFY